MNAAVQTMPATDVFIGIERLSKTYVSRDGAPMQAIAGLDVQIPKGQFVCLLGPSGCGKSTLLQILAGLQRPTTGHVSLAGSPLVGPRKDVGIVFQSPVLLPWLRVLDNVMLPAVVHRLDRRTYEKRARELIEMIGLTGFEKHFPRELSGGMEQRVALARALLTDPSMLLMDEPFGALDAMTREQMNLELLRIWAHTGKTVFLITHSLPEAVFLGDRVLVMSPRPGRLIGDIPVEVPRPRTTAVYGHPNFHRCVEQIRKLLGLPERMD